MNLEQPYVAKNTKGYKSMRVEDENIFEFYTFEERLKERQINAVPDGCVDLLYAIGKQDVKCFLGGTVLKMKKWPFEKNRIYFGVRFKPARCILPCDIEIGDIINEDIEIPLDAYGSSVGEQLYLASGIEERAQLIFEMLKKLENTEKRIGGFHSSLLNGNRGIDPKRGIESYIQKRIYETKGNISIKEISGETGYSQCYVRRVFREIHGISPKTFEKIVRFQNVLEEMEMHKDSFIYEMAQESGYYDQSHMVKEFKTFMGITPEAYLTELRKG